MEGSSFIGVGTTAVVVAATSGAPVQLTNVSSATVYYGTSSGVSPSSNDGSLREGQSSPVFMATQHLITASGIANVDVIPHPSQPGGGRRTIACPFAFDTPNLATGAALYTPTIGDILHDAWFEVDTPWDGTTPKGDIGSFVGGSLGWFGNNNVPLNMAVPDVTFEIYDASLLTQHSNANFGQVSTLLSMAYMQAYPLGSPHIVDGWVRALPAKWVTADPVKVVVSQDGTPTGASPGSTQGAAVLYLDISTPGF